MDPYEHRGMLKPTPNRWIQDFVLHLQQSTIPSCEKTWFYLSAKVHWSGRITTVRHH
jgi:hypothetical protein